MLLLVQAWLFLTVGLLGLLSAVVLAQGTVRWARSLVLPQAAPGPKLRLIR